VWAYQDTQKQNKCLLVQLWHKKALCLNGRSNIYLYLHVIHPHKFHNKDAVISVLYSVWLSLPWRGKGRRNTKRSLKRTVGDLFFYALLAQLTPWSRPFMEPEDSLQCSQWLATRPCPEPVASSPHLPTYFLKIHSNIIFKSIPRSSGFPSKILYAFLIFHVIICT
jgi:hypothetical protein